MSGALGDDLKEDTHRCLEGAVGSIQLCLAVCWDSLGS